MGVQSDSQLNLWFPTHGVQLNFSYTLLKATGRMSKHEKALAKLQANPVPADFKWDDLVSLLRHLGYKKLNNSGARRKFYNQDKNLLVSCHEPHPRSVVDKGCIVDILEHLKTHGLI